MKKHLRVEAKLKPALQEELWAAVDSVIAQVSRSFISERAARDSVAESVGKTLLHKSIDSIGDHDCFAYYTTIRVCFDGETKQFTAGQPSGSLREICEWFEERGHNVPRLRAFTEYAEVADKYRVLEIKGAALRGLINEFNDEETLVAREQDKTFKAYQELDEAYRQRVEVMRLKDGEPSFRFRWPSKERSRKIQDGDSVRLQITPKGIFLRFAG